ncbi:alkane 1-monooxygenase [Hymenobacter amundsenii]|uniref:Alkane 1-monooxygenase n=1 Tax=Hymenobacter amundsenii TaxID=2006685 RepID=A0A246FGU9_9BACT|nr:alkane 1-monooxygenase [Hymenobacter amundsenii]OWP61738.1 alkane 1-monooxygenase [Hymenobacter amundsenii]
MHLTDLRYLSAYLVPGCVAAGLAWRGPWAWLTPLFIFGLVPLLELAVPPRNVVSNEPATAGAPHHPFFDWLLYLCVPLHVGLVVWYLAVLARVPLSGAETAGLVVSMGICGGSLGINVAHELGHRSRAYEQRLAQVLLGSTLYLHFFIEHNRGHHRHVATPLDPATSRFNESFWRFLPRALGGELRSAWHLETERLRRAGGASAWSGQNQLLRFVAVQLVAVGIVALVFGWRGLLAWVGAALVGAVLFQLVNYVEHYGLLRRRTGTGAYERVQPHHSWNSEHAVGRILLYELTRHSDHHYLASRPYHTLRHQPASPQMPTGYPGMMLLAAVPPLWFRVMNRRVPAEQ